MAVPETPGLSEPSAASPANPRADRVRRPCSARGCRADAAWGLQWNNPRLHAPQRRKTWLACPEHREHLASYLRLRGLLREVVAVDDLLDPRPGPGPVTR